MDNFLEQFSSYYPGFSYIDDVSSLSHHRSSNILSIVCPGQGISQIDFAELESRSDICLLSWSNFIDCKPKYRWIELIPHFAQWHEKNDNQNWLYEDRLDITTFLYSRLFKYLSQNLDDSLFLISPLLGNPLPPRDLSPSILGFYGANWKDINHVKHIVNTYISQGHYKSKILNLRASLIRCISLGILLDYPIIRLYGVNPENPLYFFNTDNRVQISPTLAGLFHDQTSEITHNSINANKSDVHPTESNPNLPNLSRCLMYYLTALRTVDNFSTKIEHYGESQTWRLLSSHMPDIISSHKI